MTLAEVAERGPCYIADGVAHPIPLRELLAIIDEATELLRHAEENGRDRATARKWVDAAPPGYTLLFKPPVRSTDQNRRLWAFLDDIAAQKEWDGKKRTSDEWKDLFTACLRGRARGQARMTPAPGESHV